MVDELNVLDYLAYLTFLEDGGCPECGAAGDEECEPDCEAQYDDD